MAIDENKLRLCKKFYIEYGGRHHGEIQRLMRGAGYRTFTTRCLYRANGKPGYIERFNWKEEITPLRNADCGMRIRRTDVDDVSGTRSTQATINPQSAIRNPQFEAWLKHVSPQYTWHWKYQQYIYRQLERVTSGETKRLMIFMPPRHGKSELVTVRYAAWRLQQDPSLNIILGSYNQKLANRFSRKIRNVYAEAEERVGSPHVSKGSASHTANTAITDASKLPTPHTTDGALTYVRATDTHRIKRANTAEEWETPQGGGVRAVGVGAGITGFGAKLVIIDDPVKSRAEAESETYRNRLSDWFNDDIYTRLEPDAAIILIQTRWHEDDLAGRLLKDMHDGGEEWEVISFPALAEKVEEKGSRGEEESSVFSVSSSVSSVVLSGSSSSSSSVQLTTEQEEKDEESSVCSVNSVVNGFQNTLTTEHTEQNTESTEQKSSPPYEGGVAAASADGVVLSSPQLDILDRAPGEALCPERFNIDALERIKRRLGSYSFAALYQQRPAPLDGGLFKRAWFKIVDHAPKGLRWKRGYDLALSVKTSADYTASFRCAFGPNGTLYIDGGFRKRIEFPEQKRYILERMQNEPDTEHGIESALHGAAFVQELRRTPGFLNRSFRAVRADGDKFSRALAWANKAEEGSLRLVRGPWNDTFIDEACGFPHSPHDDQIDAVSIATEMLAKPKFTAMSF